jgi:TolA-binding protein
MFKQAKSFEAIGDEKTAKVIYQLLSQRYPDSAEAKSLRGKVPAKQ